MAWVHILHPVEEFDRWKSTYDDFESTKRSFGWKRSFVFASADNPNDVVVIEEFDSAKQARAFLDSAELREGMSRAGVSSPPDVRILELRAEPSA